MSTAKNFVLPIVVFILGLLLVYFGLNFIFPKAKQPEPVFLRVVGLWDESVFNVLKKEFQKKHPEITIEYEKQDLKRYYKNLSADLDSSKPPDVFWWHSGWGPNLRGKLAPLPENIMSAKEYESVFYPITNVDRKRGDAYRGFPLEFDGLALLYNKKTFASHNLTEPPVTWTTLREQYVPTFTTGNRTQIFTSGIALGSVTNVENFPEIIGLFLLQNRVKFVENGEFKFYVDRKADENKLATDAVDFYTLFSRRDRTWDNTQPNSLEAFAKGKTAMVILPAAKIHNLLGYLKEQNLQLDFAVAPLPQLPEAQVVSWGSYWGVGVSQKSPHQEAAWKLNKFLIEPDSLRTVYKYETEHNIFGRAYPRRDMAREQTTHPYLAAYLVQAEFAKSWYLHSDTYDGALNDEIIALVKKNLEKAEKGESSDGLLKKLSKELSPILKKYGVINSGAEAQK